MEHGYVTNANLDKHYCFIAIPGKPDVFANRRVFDERIDFDRTLKFRRVRLHYAEGDRGLYATRVLPAND